MYIRPRGLSGWRSTLPGFEVKTPDLARKVQEAKAPTLGEVCSGAANGPVSAERVSETITCGVAQRLRSGAAGASTLLFSAFGFIPLAPLPQRQDASNTQQQLP
jgi:hypothetical protein